VQARPPDPWQQRVQTALDQTVQKIVLIRADREVQYGAVMTALDQLRAVGVEDIGLMTDRPPTAGGAGGR
jgi:biopolymer transport protein ExbD